MSRAVPWAVVAIVAAIALLGGLRQRTDIARLDARAGLLLARGDSIDRELAAARGRDSVVSARADSLEALYQDAKDSVSVTSDTTLLVIGAPAQLVLPAPVISRIRIADARGDQWERTAAAKDSLVELLEGKVQQRDDYITVQDSIVDALRLTQPNVFDHVTLTVGCSVTPTSWCRPAAVVGVSVSARDVGRAIAKHLLRRP